MEQTTKNMNLKVGGGGGWGGGHNPLNPSLGSTFAQASTLMLDTTKLSHAK